MATAASLNKAKVKKTRNEIVLSGRQSAGVASRFPTFDEDAFLHFVTLERKRSDRSGKPFMLALVNMRSLCADRGQVDQVVSDAVFTALSSCLREIDIIGWYEANSAAGAILTEISSLERSSVVEVIRKKISDLVSSFLPEQVTRELLISIHLYPEDPNHGGDGFDEVFYPDVTSPDFPKQVSLYIKRVIDVAFSLLLLLLLSPLFLVIALAIKLNSKGPILFRQERAGYLGRPFTFFKFRSMFVGADSRLHQDYVEQFIGQSRSSTPDSSSLKQDGLYKITRDPRITSVGRFLRKSSLDELPQLWNVLKGDLSLVGPRPPIPYELKCYDGWHRRRILEVKPGLTGLWQVNGRSRTSFDDMVRLDLQYAKNWSLSLDFVLLLRTPWAVLKGDGAC